jgi:hypothetical protein
MEIIPTGQQAGPPRGKPHVVNPVKAKLNIPLYYNTERGPVPWNHGIYCSHVFAATVLGPLEVLFERNNWGLCHIGFYNPRLARTKAGKTIQPERWSNHSHGLAVDFKGTVDEDGKLTTVRQLKAKGLLDDIVGPVQTAILKANRKPEIVDEGGWLHIGIWP